MHRPPLSSCFPSIKQNDCAFGLILLTPKTRDQHSRQFPGWPRVLPFARSVCLLARVAALHHPASSGITTAAGKPPPPAISDAAPGWSDDAPGTQRVATLNPSCIRLQEAAEFPRFVALLCASSTQHHMKAKSRVQSREGLPVVLVRGRCWAIGRSAVNVPLLIHTQAFRTEGQKSCGYRLPLPIVSGHVESETHRITWPPIADETAQRAKCCWFLATGQSSASAEALPLPLQRSN